MFVLRPVEEFVRKSIMRIALNAGSVIYDVTKGKYPRQLFLKNVSHKKIYTGVKIIKKTDDSVYIAKYNPDNSISDEDFNILIATDMHVGDDAYLREKTFRMLYKNIEKVKPDLIIFTGDIILSRLQQFDCLQFAKFMEEIGIYWAVIFGNHEAREEKGFFKYFLLKNMNQYPHCLSLFGPPELFGYGNFFVNILNSNEKVYKSLVFFDSGRNVTEKYRKEYALSEKYDGYDFIKENQILWYEKNIKTLRQKNGNVRSLLFMHIPLPEFAEVMHLTGSSGEIPYGIPTGKAEIISGNIHEKVSCPKYNSGLFERALKLGAQGFFAGHDHMNDFWAKYKGVYLVYNQFSGYDEYSFGKSYMLPEKDWIQGTTELILKKDGSISLKRHLYSDYINIIKG